MKKMIFGVALVAAMAMNAATIDWKVTVDTADKQKQFMFFNYADQADVLALLEAGGEGLYDKVAEYAYATTAGEKQFATTAKSTSKSGGLATIEKGEDMFYVLFDTTATGTLANDVGYKYSDKISTAGMIYDPNAKPPESSPGTLQFTAAQLTKSGTTGSGGGVPEPTSGLLVLLGMAGLALRRKQA